MSFGVWTNIKGQDEEEVVSAQNEIEIKVEDAPSIRIVPTRATDDKDDNKDQEANTADNHLVRRLESELGSERIDLLESVALKRMKFWQNGEAVGGAK